MTNSVESIPLDNLVAHPDNPNEMSRVNFAKLVRNIERTSRYEPMIVRPCPGKGKKPLLGKQESAYFQIINGHHRCQALRKLGYKIADCIVWDIDDEQTDILLATLNRLGGSDELGKKLKLLKRLNKRMESGQLGKLLPQKQKQIERLANLKMPTQPAKSAPTSFANPMVFFVNDTQQLTIENAMSLAATVADDDQTKAAKKAAALVHIAKYFLNNSTTDSGGFQ